MALTRKFLSALGIEQDKIDEIITAHTETVDALKSERDGFKDAAEKLPEVQKELDALKTEAAKNGGKDAFKVKYEAIKEEFTEFKTKVENEKKAESVKNAYRAMLKEAGIAEKRIDAVLRVSDLDSVQLDEDGAIIGKDKLIESTKTEWADFVVKSSEQGANPANPPANNSTDYDKMSDEDYYNATYKKG